MGDVLILGGYGNFGKRIAHALVRSGVPIGVAGRSAEKAALLAAELRALYPNSMIQAHRIDADKHLVESLLNLKPTVVVNTCGPFQRKDYSVAEACIAAGAHYIDLADGREFVTGITALDTKAKAAKLCVISGASTVPGLSSAVLEHFKDAFLRIDSLTYGISPGQKAERGLATTQGILTYIGKRLKAVPGDTKPRYGWQDIYIQDYPELGRRWMANCDVPDLDLLPIRYGIKHIRFSAGMENTILHLGIWLLSWLVRLGLPMPLESYAAFLLHASHWFNSLGTDAGGMHMVISGTGKDGNLLTCQWFIVAKDGDGPQIPCVPAIVLARQLALGKPRDVGAQPCVAMVTYEQYLEELKAFAIQAYTH